MVGVAGRTFTIRLMTPVVQACELADMVYAPAAAPTGIPRLMLEPAPLVGVTVHPAGTVQSVTLLSALVGMVYAWVVPAATHVGPVMAKGATKLRPTEYTKSTGSQPP
jgi:hypothetical protein